MIGRGREERAVSAVLDASVSRRDEAISSDDALDGSE
jgi:hypothetical protein